MNICFRFGFGKKKKKTEVVELQKWYIKLHEKCLTFWSSRTYIYNIYSISQGEKKCLIYVDKLRQ